MNARSRAAAEEAQLKSARAKSRMGRKVAGAGAVTALVGGGYLARTQLAKLRLVVTKFMMKQIVPSLRDGTMAAKGAATKAVGSARGTAAKTAGSARGAAGKATGTARGAATKARTGIKGSAEQKSGKSGAAGAGAEAARRVTRAGSKAARAVGGETGKKRRT